MFLRKGVSTITTDLMFRSTRARRPSRRLQIALLQGHVLA